MDCSVCQHPGKSEIERLLVSGASLRKVAEQFNLGRMALLRHKQNHMVCHGSTVTSNRDKLPGSTVTNERDTVTSVTTERDKLPESTVTNCRDERDNHRDKDGDRDNIDLYRYAKSKRLPEWDCYALWFWEKVYRDSPDGEKGRFAKEKILLPLLEKYPFLEEVVDLEG